MSFIRWLYISFAILLSAGCSLQGDRTEFTHAYAAQMCGPADGPALRITVTTENVGCDRLPQRTVGRMPESSYLVVWVLGITDPEVPSVLRLGAEAEASPSGHEGGWAELCRKGRECTDVASGTVTFDDVPNGNVAMSMELTFEDGSEIATTTKIRECGRAVICP